MNKLTQENFFTDFNASACYCVAPPLKGAIYECRQNRQTLAAYDSALAAGVPETEVFILENKAGYLASLGREGESIVIYESLVGKTSGADNERIVSNIKSLKQTLDEKAKMTKDKGR